jgi:hypothetical protein
MQPPQALANGASQGPKHSADEQNNPSAYVFSLTLLPTAKRFSPINLIVKLPALRGFRSHLS